jgi:lipoate-protein ligase A
MAILQCSSHCAADPWFNMAFDEAMLGDVARRPEIIHLRLYTWLPGAITIGVNQEVARAVRLNRLGETPLLRRITGGRAVYHDPAELTYSVALNLDNPILSDWQTSVQDVYLRLAEGLQQFLGRMGLSAQIVRRSAGMRSNKTDQITAPCFESVARYELTVDGGKILASAQRQVGRAILQHGSIKLQGLAGHPALPGGGNLTVSAAQPIEPAHLGRLSTQLRETFLNWFGIPDVSHTQDDSLLDGLEARLTLVRSEPLARRVPVER